MRILLATPSYYPNIGGVEYVVKSIAERLAALGHETTVVNRRPEGRQTPRGGDKRRTRNPVAHLGAQRRLPHTQGEGPARKPPPEAPQRRRRGARPQRTRGPHGVGRRGGAEDKPGRADRLHAALPRHGTQRPEEAPLDPLEEVRGARR